MDRDECPLLMRRRDATSSIIVLYWLTVCGRGLSTTAMILRSFLRFADVILTECLYANRPKFVVIGFEKSPL